MMTRLIAAAFHRTLRFRWLSIMAALVASGCMTSEGGFDPFGTAKPGTPPVDIRLAADPEAFSQDGIALWNGQVTQAGAWIAHPDIAEARQVRITNTDTGAKVDAAMFRRDPGIDGPRIIVSAAAARALGLAEGQATPITIVALRYRAPDEIAADASPETQAAAQATKARPPQEPTAAPIEAADEQPDPAIEVGPLDGAVDADPAEDRNAHAATDEPRGSETQVAPNAKADPLTAAIEAALESLPSADATAPVSNPAAYAPGPDTPVPQPRPQRELAPAIEGAISDGRQFVHAGTYADPEEAAALAERLRTVGLAIEIQPLTRGTEQLSRVLVGPYETVAERDAALVAVRRAGVSGAAPSGG